MANRGCPLHPAGECIEVLGHACAVFYDESPIVAGFETVDVGWPGSYDKLTARYRLAPPHVTSPVFEAAQVIEVKQPMTPGMLASRGVS